jgi:hypothetical protein
MQAQIGFLTEWQGYAQQIEGEKWRGEKMDKAKIDKMSGAYLPYLPLPSPSSVEGAILIEAQMSKLRKCTSSCKPSGNKSWKTTTQSSKLLSGKVARIKTIRMIEVMIPTVDTPQLSFLARLDHVMSVTVNRRSTVDTSDDQQEAGRYLEDELCMEARLHTACTRASIGRGVHRRDGCDLTSPSRSQGLKATLAAACVF